MTDSETEPRVGRAKRPTDCGRLAILGGGGGGVFILGSVAGGGGGIAESFWSISVCKWYNDCLCSSYALKLPPRMS